MRRALLAASLAVLSCIHAAPGTSPAAAGGATSTQLPSAVADSVWNPTGVQVYEWVNDGINAAASEVGLQDVPGVRRWVWGYPDGAPIGRGQRLRFVIVATPQFIATVVGWAAAQNESTWARIQIDQEEIAEGLTRGVARQWRARRGDLLIAVGIEGEPQPNDGYRPAVALYYNNAWRCIHDGRFSTLRGSARAGRSHTGSSALWAVTHVLSDGLDREAFDDPDSTTVALLELQRVALGPTSTVFDPRLPTPSMPMLESVRVAVGDPDSLQHVDLGLEAE